MTTMRFLVFCVLFASTLQHDAYFSLTPPGFHYQPSNIILHLSTVTDVQMIADCARLCLDHLQCRTFDFDQDTITCQLFEGSIDTGTLIVSPTSSVVGWIDIQPSDYLLYHASFDRCVNHRYLYSDVVTGLCVCPAHTVWNGSMCVNQRFEGDSCVNDAWCRSDLNLRCNSSLCSQYSTSSTTTSTATATRTTLTITLPCEATFSSNGSLYNIVNPTVPMNSYTCFARTWIATNTSATLSFEFRNDPGYWNLDDVAVYHGMNQILINGDFENDLAMWNLTGNCDSNRGAVYYSSSYTHSGSYYYADGCVNATDTLSQTFATVPGDTYQIIFWLAIESCCSPVTSANIMIG